MPLGSPRNSPDGLAATGQGIGAAVARTGARLRRC